MKPCLFTILIFILILSSLLAVESNDERKILVGIPFKTSQDKETIINQQIDVLSSTKTEIKAIVKASEIKQIEALGFKVRVIFDDYRQESPQFWGKAISPPYHNYAAVQQYLQTVASENPQIAQYYVLGKSVNNRDIIALKMTDNPLEEEIEPEVRLVALHHGNELSSSEFLLYLIRYLVDHYKSSDPEITELINTTEIWIIPVVNPDGMEASPSPTRYNVHGYDLNRNYPCPNGSHWSIGGPYAFSEPETRAIRDFSLPTGNAINNSFVLSLTYHAGTTCFNYVWNYTPTLAPDNDLLITQANQYSTAAHNAGLTSFWITNGYQWYQTIGELNDWAYGFYGILDSTIECTDDYTPNVSTQEQIDAFCYPHLRGTLSSLWLAGEGIRGRVVDYETSQPLLATIKVEEINKSAFTDPTHWGDFYRVLLPGTYTVEISAEGYLTEFKPEIEVGEWKAQDKGRNYTDLGLIRLIRNDHLTGNLWILK